MKLGKDPVCGMEVDESTATAKSKVGNATFYFCCPHCKARFDKDPLKFTME
jgi:YHS domain-containing protein